MRCTRRTRMAEEVPIPRKRSERAAVLLEVVLALTLFVFAAGVISSSLQTAVDRTLRLHDQTHALDLAASVMAEIEMGLRPPQATSAPQPFDVPFDSWTWQIEASAFAFGTGDAAPLQRVQVIVRNTAGTAVQRLTEILATDNSAAATGTNGMGLLP